MNVTQQETSIEGQLKVCFEYCERNDYNVVEEYIDRALSGTTDNRPAFQRMIADSKKKFFQYVIEYQFDRFSHDKYDSAIYKRELKKMKFVFFQLVRILWMIGYKVGEDKFLAIDPNTSPIVKRIFEMYADGQTVKEITEHLNTLRYTTSIGNPFNKNSLRTI